jgi:hypothetical protein
MGYMGGYSCSEWLIVGGFSAFGNGLSCEPGVLGRIEAEALIGVE